MDAERPVALITGGTHRVGGAIVAHLFRAGYRVALTFRNRPEVARQLAAEVGGCAIHADLIDQPSATDEIVAAFARFSGRLDLLVNNASSYEPGFDLALARRMMAIHYEAPAQLARAFEAQLRASRGSIVNMIDILAERPMPNYQAYCASKAALANLTLSLARQFSPEVTVNGISPGVVEWPPELPPAERETYLKRVPLARPGTPQDVAALVHFLATGGKYITGQIIRLDGGRSIV